ncbi:MAG TPA: PhoD-like phosphatase [Cyanobacteria bacterium UBA8803]|nr:PhoD-like phosphatase [Cyanobacteria bacterium UBA9273]HBL58479.1 PhoD-like phosphatase [Cyanobacteria bacterium UBA8803]
MSQTPLSACRYHIQLSDRLSNLPLLLAGPILRRTESNAVTVWVALKAPCTVTLNVYATKEDGSVIQGLLLKGTSSTVAIGKHLHIIAITAQPVTLAQLEPGQIYAYDLNFDNPDTNLARALSNIQCPSQVTVSYFAHQLPTFAIPPADLNDLRLAHGSCRKLHGGGGDALPLLDDLVGYYAKQANARPHQLFFTGDQIYGDDVADIMLWVATGVGDILLGWEENLPCYPTPTPNAQPKKPSEFLPGQRTDIAEQDGGFTAMHLNSPEEAKSHLFSLGEYCAAYLLTWSPTLWPESLPKGAEIHQNRKQAKQWDKEASRLSESISQLWKVRRVMANIPTYMICDDHDITDDWYLNRAWCNRVLGKPLGRRVVQNGLLAYALFQAWGNTPEQFQPGQPGGNLLKAATIWSASAGTDEAASEVIAKCLGLPPLVPHTGLPQLKLDRDVLILDRDYPDGTVPLEWHYAIASHSHEVIVLDTRTWRGYPPDDEDGTAPPWLLSPTAFLKQIQQPLERTSESDIKITFIVVPTNLVSLQIIDRAQRWELEKGNVFNSDVGDAWNMNEVALSRLLAELFQKRRLVVVLSGDIHYAAAIRLSYWSGDSKSITNSSTARVLVQLTASPFQNSELKTQLIHTKLKSLLPEPSQDWVGWQEPPEMVEIQVTPGAVRRLNVKLPTTRPMVRLIRGMRGNWHIAWAIAIKDANSLPDWQYHIEWIKRQRARLAPWLDQGFPIEIAQPKKPASWLRVLGNVLSPLWCNPWIQEGSEVVGRNNFGLIRCQWSQNPEEVSAVIQDIYWQPPWQSTSVVYSRYWVSVGVLHQTQPPIF